MKGWFSLLDDLMTKYDEILLSCLGRECRLEYEKLAVERARLKQEDELKQAEIEANLRADNNELGLRLLKRYGETLALILVPQTDDVTELPAYFRSVEMQFDKFKITDIQIFIG